MLFLTWMPVGGAVALANSNEDCASFLRPAFYSDPKQVSWQVDFRALCPVTQQGLLSTCWASAGVSFLKPLLVRAGLIKANENLSRDYYSALIMREFATAYRKGRMEIFIDELGPYFSTEVYRNLLKSGIVLEGEYRFPKLAIISKEGKSVTRDIRVSPELQEAFIDELNEVRGARSAARFNEVLDAYLGDPSRVTPRTIPLSLIQNHEPEVWVTDPMALKRLQDEVLASMDLKIVNPEKVEAAVMASLDLGNPVMVTISKLEHFERMRSTEASLIREAVPTGEFGGEHAVTILGYGTGSDGEIWYLLQNNGGRRWGHQGSIAVSGEFLRTEIERFFILK